MTIRHLLFVFALGFPANASSFEFDADERRPIAEVPAAPWAEDDPADSLYRAGREAINREDFRRAAALFAEISRRYPRSEYAEDASYWRAFALYRIGREDDLREALRALKSQKDKFPKAKTTGDANTLAVRIRGALARQGDASAAEAVSSAASESGDCPSGSENDIRTEALNALLQMDAEGALPILKQVLQKRDACSAPLRKKAVFLLSQKRTSETEALLIDAIRNDPSRAVREDAVFWMGQIRTERALSALEDIASSSTDARLREKAVFALGQQGLARGVAVVRRLAEDGGAPGSVREQAIFQLGQRRSQENADFLRALFGRLGAGGVSGGDALRKKVLFSLSQMSGVGNDRWLLSVALDDAHSEDVRKHALWTAGQAGIPSSELITMYDQITSRPLKEQLIWVLSDSRDRAASDKLVEIAQKDRDPEMRKKAIFWLGQKNDPRIRQILIDIIRQ